jgi:hypothetical protein
MSSQWSRYWPTVFLSIELIRPAPKPPAIRFDNEVETTAIAQAIILLLGLGVLDSRVCKLVNSPHFRADQGYHPIISSDGVENSPAYALVISGCTWRDLDGYGALLFIFYEPRSARGWFWKTADSDGEGLADGEGFVLPVHICCLQLTDSTLGQIGQKGQKSRAWAQFGHTIVWCPSTYLTSLGGEQAPTPRTHLRSHGSAPGPLPQACLARNHNIAPRPPRSDRRMAGRTVRWFKWYEPPRIGFGLGCRWRYGHSSNSRWRTWCRIGVLPARSRMSEVPAITLRSGRTLFLTFNYRMTWNGIEPPTPAFSGP